MSNNREIIANNDKMYFYRVYYLLEACLMIEKRNDDLYNHGKPKVNVDQKMTHDVLDSYITGKCQQLEHNRHLGKMLF